MVKKLSPDKRHNSMRGWFAHKLHQLMIEDKSIWVVTGDLGYGMFDAIKQDFPSRFLNVGSAEQAMIDIGIGLTLEGRKPVMYSITPFLLYRPFEALRNYINYEKIPVILVGGGRNRAYPQYGISHWAEEDKQIMKILPNIQAFWPQTKEEVPSLLEKIIKKPKPTYLNLSR